MVPGWVSLASQNQTGRGIGPRPDPKTNRAGPFWAGFWEVPTQCRVLLLNTKRFINRYHFYHTSRCYCSTLLSSYIARCVLHSHVNFCMKEGLNEGTLTKMKSRRPFTYKQSIRIHAYRLFRYPKLENKYYTKLRK